VRERIFLGGEAVVEGAAETLDEGGKEEGLRGGGEARATWRQQEERRWRGGAALAGAARVGGGAEGSSLLLYMRMSWSVRSRSALA
jgi:hypothetical protein